MEEEDEEANVAEEFVFGQLLLMTEFQDYSDEMGRREMANILRDLLIRLDLSEEILDATIRTLKKVCGNDDEFLRYATHF